jgi:symplekin
VEDFSLDDLPAGHPVITREALESIAEYAFTTLRGLTLMGGQVKIDANILSDMLLTSGGGGSPSAQVVTILKPAALAYLEIEATLKKTGDNTDVLDYTVDRSQIEFDFEMSQKSYSLSINAMSSLAANRPVFFKEAAICLCRRAIQPPTYVEGGHLTNAAVLAIVSQLKASCLMLLRNALSVATNSYDILHRSLETYDMEIQAEKALSMARKATALKTAGRAARNVEKMYYEWDASETDRVSRRQRETDDALANMRAAKAARGLGYGIQLPTSMSDCVDLILANLSHLAAKRPTSSAATKLGQVSVSLDSVIDSIMTNGASLSHEEGHWYERDGTTAWEVDMQSREKYTLEPSFLDTFRFLNAQSEGEGLDESGSKRRKVFVEQSQAAASNAVARILLVTTNSRFRTLGKLGNALAARLSFVLQGVKPSSAQEVQYSMALESIKAASTRLEDSEIVKSLLRFVEAFPLVAASLGGDGTSSSDLGEFVLNEALLQSCAAENTENVAESLWKYDCSLAIYVAVAVHAGEIANAKPSDVDRQLAAANATAKLQLLFPKLPRVTDSAICLLGALCDNEEITKKASTAQRKSALDSMGSYGATHAAKVASDIRATAALLILRDTAFQRDLPSIRKSAVQCAVSVASSRLPSSAGVQEKALKLVMNVFFPKNDSFADYVSEAAMEEIEWASLEAVSIYDSIEAAAKKDSLQNTPLAPRSEEEKKYMERLRRPAVLCMALCVRRPELVKRLFELCCIEKADVLSKTVRANMGKLSKAIALKHGVTEIALKVADMTGPQEVSMLLSFLENLAPSSDRSIPEQEVIDACFKIQELKLTTDGKKDPRFIIPVVSAMLRKDLVDRLPEFVAADDKIFLAALVRMGDRVERQALFFRDEVDQDNPALRGMTLCEQLVFLHRLDFTALNLPQRAYLGAIKLCLSDEEVYNDRVVMSALDQISGVFLTGAGKLPLAFMRTCIMVCSQHESLHSWICNELLPRLVDGKIYEDPRQWEGWMRCAHMLENSDDPSVSSTHAVSKLPPEQLVQYRTKWEGK